MIKLTPYFKLLSLLFLASTIEIFGQHTMQVKQILPLESLNTNADESMPVVNPEGNRLYFMRTNVGKGKLSKAGQEIWSSELNEGVWESPSPKQLSVNDRANNAVIGVSVGSQRVYLFNSPNTRHKLAKGLGYVELEEDGNYGSPIGITVPGFEVGNGYYSFYVTPDEQQLFISTATDSVGYEDLFVSIKQDDGGWGRMVHLGNEINSPAIETTPYLTVDKRRLYFSSNGHSGEGQLDIFYSDRLGDGWTTWTTPVNMGRPINSEKFDANFILINDNKAIFSSNRATELSDLYEVTLKNKEQDLPAVENVQQIAKSAILFREEQGLMVGKLDLTRLPSTYNTPALLLVKDENGKVVDTLTVNNEGEFTFEALPSDDYSFSLIGVEDEGLVAFDMKEDVKDSSSYYPLKDITIIKQAGGLMVGKLDLTRLPSTYNTPALLLVKDENGKVVDTLTVNNEGEFTFEALPSDDYSFFLIGVEDEGLIASDMKEDVKDSSSYYPLKDITIIKQAGGLLVGKLDLTRLPSTHNTPTLLLVKDENGKVVDTLTVNNEGEFTFEALPSDDYSFSLIGVEDEGLIAFDMKEANPNLFSPSNFKDSAEIKSNGSVSTSLISATDEQVKTELIKVYFGFDSAQIPDTAFARINAFISSLLNKTIIKIKLTGYTDSSGATLYNLQLSEMRAKAVKDYFISQGLFDEKIVSIGKGEDNPDFPNDSRKGRILNRRVMVEVWYKE